MGSPGFLGQHKDFEEVNHCNQGLVHLEVGIEYGGIFGGEYQHFSSIALHKYTQVHLRINNKHQIQIEEYQSFCHNPNSTPTETNLTIVGFDTKFGLHIICCGSSTTYGKLAPGAASHYEFCCQ